MRRFDPVLKALPTLIPDGFIYLQAEPGTCLRRMQGRGRLEEGGVSLDYLANLHQKHEEWLAGPPQPDLLARPGRNQVCLMCRLWGTCEDKHGSGCKALA